MSYLNVTFFEYKQNNIGKLPSVIKISTGTYFMQLWNLRHLLHKITYRSEESEIIGQDQTILAPKKITN